MKRIFVFALLLGFQSVLNAQLNNYKYIIVPVKFKAFKNPNQFQTSTLIKHFMSQEGFNVIYDNSLPLELEKNRCLALFTDLLDESTLFKTKVSLVLKDCKGNIIFKTLQAQSKTKDLNQAFKEVVTTASASFIGLDHDYQPRNEETNADSVAVTSQNVEEQGVVSDSPDKVVVAQVSSQNLKTPENIKGVKKVSANGANDSSEKKWLYAEPIENGFQLKNEAGNIIYNLQETSIENVFLVNQKNLNGVILKKSEKWYLEYQGDKGKVIEELQIKF